MDKLNFVNSNANIDRNVYLKVIGEGVQDSGVFGAKLQADGAVHEQCKPLMAHITVAFYHHHACDCLL